MGSGWDDLEELQMALHTLEQPHLNLCLPDFILMEAISILKYLPHLDHGFFGSDLGVVGTTLGLALSMTYRFHKREKWQKK